MSNTLVVVAVALGIAGVFVAALYNSLVSRRNAVRNAFASIDVQLKKRWDLIPALVETVKGYASHEQSLFSELAAARSEAQIAPGGAADERVAAEGRVGAGLARLIAVSEDYPELGASEQFEGLQRNLAEVEAQIAASRRAYNAAVTAYNNAVQQVPGVFFAGPFGFAAADWFRVPDGQGDTVAVELD